MKTLSKTPLFWDIDQKKLGPIKHKKFIIERILQLGDVEDFRWAVSYYGKNEIKKTLIKNKSLDKKSQNFWCLYFEIDPKKCTKNQSIRKQNPFWKR